MENELKAIESPVEILRAMEAAASPAPWEPNCVHEMEGDGAWGAGPLVEPFSPEDLEMLEQGDWDQGAQLSLAKPDADLIATMRNLAPELLALWEACNTEKIHACLGDIAEEALDALNRKATSLA